MACICHTLCVYDCVDSIGVPASAASVGYTVPFIPHINDINMLIIYRSMVYMNVSADCLDSRIYGHGAVVVVAAAATIVALTLGSFKNTFHEGFPSNDDTVERLHVRK